MMNHVCICYLITAFLPLMVLSLSSDQHSTLQNQAYAKARVVRARMGHSAAKKLYQILLEENKGDITAGTRLAAGALTPQRHDAACPLLHEKIKSLRRLLDDCCYDNCHIQQIFGINAQHKLFKSSGPVYVKPACAGDPSRPLVAADEHNNSSNISDDLGPKPLQCLVSLFLLGIAVPRKILIKFLGEQSLNLLEDLGLAFPCETNPEYVVPFVHLFPMNVKTITAADIEADDVHYSSTSYKNLILATDLHPRVLSSTSAGTENHGTVMYIGPDSLALVQHMPLLTYLKNKKLCCSSSSAATSSLPPPLRILDFCTGSGIQALSTLVTLNSKESNLYATAMCVDYNPRALRFTQFNAILNGLSAKHTPESSETTQVDVLHADLISGMTIPKKEANDKHGSKRDTATLVEALLQKIAPLENQDSSHEYYDIILANPPFIPVPPNDKEIEQRYGLFSSGGADGEDVLKGIVDASSQVIQPHAGLLGIVSEYMNPPTTDIGSAAIDRSNNLKETETSDMALLYRLQRWWSQPKHEHEADATSKIRRCTVDGTGILFTNKFPVDAEKYAMRRADSQEMYSKWVKHLSDLTITHVSPGLLFVRTYVEEGSTTNGGKHSNKLSITHRLVPKSDSGSIWTPSNMEAIEFTENTLNKEHFWSCN